MANKKDRERFERMMLGHLDAAYNLALWLVREPAEAEDIVQTAYMRAFEHFATFNGGNAAGWILTIVRNTAYNWLNKQKRNSNLVSLDDILLNNESFQLADTNTMTPEEIVAAAAGGSRLMELMERLPVEFREVLFLRELEGYSYKEIAEITQVPKGTVMSRLSRARGLMQKMLTDQQKRKHGSGM